MRLIEALKAIRNKIIRHEDKTRPEENQKQPDAPETLEVPKKAEPEHEKLVRRYRAYAYHHKKKRIRKKYLKKLIEISPVDRLVYFARKSGVSSVAMQEGVQRFAASWTPRPYYTPGSIGSRKEDHGDSRIKGGIL